MTHAVLGIRTHSGWAAIVGLAGPVKSPVIVERRRIEMADPDDGEAKQPYHAAEELEITAARALIRRHLDEAAKRATEALRATVADLKHKGYDVTGCGILLSSGRPAGTLEATLASHALIHSAEGDHFREAIGQACKNCRVRVSGVKERELYGKAAATLTTPEDDLRRQITELGRKLGPPWTTDQKLAALAAWLTLWGSQS